jgi:hypothetical protein
MLHSTTPTAVECQTAVLGLEVIDGQLLPPEILVADKASPKAVRQLGDGKRTTLTAEYLGPHYFGVSLGKEMSISCRGDSILKNQRTFIWNRGLNELTSVDAAG